jgi:hypothetical protein
MSTVFLVKLIVAHSKKSLPLSVEPGISTFFKSRLMTADYSRKINAVTSGIFAKGFKNVQRMKS